MQLNLQDKVAAITGTCINGDGAIAPGQCAASGDGRRDSAVHVGLRMLAPCVAALYCYEWVTR